MSSSYRLWLCRWSKKPGASGKKCLGLKKCCMQGTWQVNYRWMLERWEIGNRLCEKNKIISVTIMSLSLSHLSADEFPEWFMLRENVSRGFFIARRLFCQWIDTNYSFMIWTLNEWSSIWAKVIKAVSKPFVSVSVPVSSYEMFPYVYWNLLNGYCIRK